MSRNLWLGLVLVFAVAVCAGVSTMAQDEGPGGGGRRGGGGPGGGGPGGGGGMMGGGAAMVTHKDHIFVLSGPRLLKVDPEQMKVVGELELMGGPGMGGGRKGGRGGGGPAGEGEEPR